MVTLRPIQSHRLYVRTIIAARAAGVMKLSEKKFNELIRDVENDPVFKKLMFTDNIQQKAIGYKRFPKTDLSGRFYELKEEIAADTTPPDIQSLIAGKKHIVDLVKKLGIDRFKKYFLYNDSDKPIGDIAVQCGIGVSEAVEINRLLNEISIHSEFFQHSAITRSGLRYTNIGTIEDDGATGFIIKFSIPNLARGRYTVDYGKIEKMKKHQILSRKELKNLKELLKKIELINLRKTVLFSVIQQSIKFQNHFLNTQNITNMKAFTQRRLAQMISISSSTVCRVISMKSINTPWGEEVSLKDFFPSRKTVCKRLTMKLVGNEKKAFSDKKITELIAEKFNIQISRSLIYNCRKELNIPSSFERQVISDR